MKRRNRIIKYITAFVVIALVLNPETLQLAFFIDALGLEMILLLFEVQLLAIGILVYSRTIKPLVTFLVGHTLRPLLAIGKQIKEDPTILVFMVPSEATGMHLLVFGAAIGVVCHAI